jgi:hypothetical protein
LVLLFFFDEVLRIELRTLLLLGKGSPTRSDFLFKPSSVFMQYGLPVFKLLTSEQMSKERTELALLSVSSQSCVFDFDL